MRIFNDNQPDPASPLFYRSFYESGAAIILGGAMEG